MITSESIRNDNLYITGYVVDFPEQGESLLLRTLLAVTGDETDDYYLFTQGDKLRLIANIYYQGKVPNAANLWWVIADANNIQNPFDMDSFIGKELLIPNYDKVKLFINND